MKITPLDIRKMVFKVRLRGYDRQDVDQFLEELAQTVEMQNRDHTVLREKLASVEQQLGDLKKVEATLMNTLVTTQALAAELKHAAQRDAELIMKEAELKAGELLREAQAELAGTQRDLSDLRKQKLMAIERLRSTLRTFERMLEIEEGDERLSAPADRPEKIADGSNR